MLGTLEPAAVTPGSMSRVVGAELGFAVGG